MEIERFRIGRFRQPLKYNKIPKFNILIIKYECSHEIKRGATRLDEL